MVSAAIDSQFKTKSGRTAVWLYPTLLVVALAGCVSEPTPDQMSRTALETAPADLQLLCANHAATSAGIDSTKVLPTRSRKLDSKSFQVELNVGGTLTNCTIDTDGKILSIQPA